MSFQPRSLVNGGLLRKFTGRQVSIIVKVDGDCSGRSITARTTDNHNIRISLADPLNGRPTEWVEIIGTVAGDDAIKAREVIYFEEGDQEFDFASHNFMVQLVHNCDDFYKME